jgi:hypothetical protein
VLAQYIVKVSGVTGTNATVDLFVGSRAVTTLAQGPDGYTTPPLAPGAAHAMTLKVTPNVESAQGISRVTVSLWATDRIEIDRVYTQTNIKAPARATSAAELFVKQGSQPYVGGVFSGQVMTAPTITTTGTATYKVKLQNDSAASSAVGLVMDGGAGSCALEFPITVKDGSTDVTAAAKAGTYSVTLAPAAARTLTVTVKYASHGFGCTSALWTAISFSGTGGTIALLNTNLP